MKLAVCSHQKESGDQVRPSVTRSSSRRMIEDVLKDNQQKMTQRRKLKRKMIVEEDVPVQPENVLDPEEGQKDPEDILLSIVKCGKQTSPPASRSRSTVTKRFPTKRIASNSQRRSKNCLAEDVPAKSVTSIRTKRNPLSIDRPSEGPGTSSVSKVLTRVERQALMKQQKVLRGRVFDPDVAENFTKEVERLTALLAQRDAEIANLKAAQTEGPGPMQALR
ncbi:hypothetical protein HAX54_041046 [Datura stramonium]|uniref:Uncharacterized protein n=1 Tax=Datura stramonium TaxID=4076 RepID=A0ABS8VQ51_DATST|nr:hypothetical protein [Datura stramonium]